VQEWDNLELVVPFKEDKFMVSFTEGDCTIGADDCLADGNHGAIERDVLFENLDVDETCTVSALEHCHLSVLNCFPLFDCSGRVYVKPPFLLALIVENVHVPIFDQLEALNVEVLVGVRLFNEVASTLFV